MKTICSKRAWRTAIGKNLFVFIAILLTASFVYFYIDTFKNQTSSSNFLESYDDFSATPLNKLLKKGYNNQKLLKAFYFTSSDVLVFIHIQKTAGTTFEKFLVRYQKDLPCECQTHRKRCNCSRNDTKETWLFSRYSTGWVCGLHADFTELVVNNCVQKVLDRQSGKNKRRNYLYTTFLRNPTERFISEFRHVQRGATWISSKHVCNGKAASLNDLPTCFDPRIGWEGVSLEEFISCPYNLAFNRQTRMLANLTLVNCYEHIRRPSHEQDKIMLESAKENLIKMPFFGLKERMDDSQWLFENTFGMKFNRKMSVWGKSKSNDTILTKSQFDFIDSVNKLDWKLYQFAVELFESRIEERRSYQEN